MAERGVIGQGAAASPPVVVIAGPTASGKSALALGLAEAAGGTVINADSVQLYEELRIVTARPGPEDLARAPHRLYGILPGDQRCSAGQWQRLALAEVAAARAAGRLPIVVGGTGLYLSALLNGLSPIPEVPAAVRSEATARHAALGGGAFHAELARRDPVMAARLRPSDRQRLIRAWEMLEATGRSLAHWQAQRAEGALDGPRVVLRMLPPRAVIRAAIDARFEGMVAAGALDEVRALVARGYPADLPVMKAHGVVELAAYLRGALTLPEAIATAQAVTRGYAKRQVTWLRHQPLGPAHASHVISEQFSESLLAEILLKVRNSR